MHRIYVSFWMVEMQTSCKEAYMFPWWARHETPVLASPLRIIHVDEELLVLDKPCSLPVSQCVGTV